MENIGFRHSDETSCPRLHRHLSIVGMANSEYLVSKLDDAIAVMFEERGGQSFADFEDEITEYVTYHTSRGRKVWVFRKAETWNGYEKPSPPTDRKLGTTILP